MRPVLLALLALGCTDAELYHRRSPPIEANRVAVSGRVCTEDPDLARFPTRLILVVDQAAGPLFSDYDPDARRIDLLSRLVQSALSRPEYAVAVIGYGGRAVKLAPAEGAFGRNPGELLNAITRLSLPQGCVGESRCRVYEDALRVAGTLIEDDLAALPAGDRILTRYEILLVNAGPAEPMARSKDCCADGDRGCLDQGDNPASPACQAQLDTRRAQALGDLVSDARAAGLQLHVAHLDAVDDAETRDALADAHQQLAFAGAGRYARYAPGAAFDITPLGLFDHPGSLRAKQLVVANLNAMPSPDGPVPDSDADGLPDDAEPGAGTSPTARDTDDDGIGDLVEILVGLDPTIPDAPSTCAALEPSADDDRDGLTDCEEAIVGTDPSLVDTDGDALPDRLELALGTDYLNPDGVFDSDLDGVSNSDEVREHTDPRTVDLASRLGDAYRYTVVDEGTRREPVAAPLEQLTGVEIIGVSAGSAPGLGLLSFDPGPPAQLSWRDAGDDRTGAAVQIEGTQIDETQIEETPAEANVFELPSGSFAPVQGDNGRRIFVRVDRAQLPPRATAERAHIAFRVRQCFAYKVRNIRLVDTLAAEGSSQTGENDLLLYFAQAPEGRPEAPGPYRLAFVPIRYVPPDFRAPAGAVIEVADDEFVTARSARPNRPAAGP